MLSQFSSRGLYKLYECLGDLKMAPLKFSKVLRINDRRGRFFFGWRPLVHLNHEKKPSYFPNTGLLIGPI